MEKKIIVEFSCFYKILAGKTWRKDTTWKT